MLRKNTIGLSRNVSGFCAPLDWVNSGGYLARYSWRYYWYTSIFSSQIYRFNVYKIICKLYITFTTTKNIATHLFQSLHNNLILCTIFSFLSYIPNSINACTLSNISMCVVYVSKQHPKSIKRIFCFHCCKRICVIVNKL